MSLHFGRSAAVAAFAFFICASSAHADTRPARTEQPASRTVAERLQPSAASVLAASAPAQVPLAVEEKPGPAETEMRPAGRGSAVPLIAAGLVLLIAGAIVEGDAGTILMVGGAGITAYGVYLYVH